jgi:hypothetical protein
MGRIEVSSADDGSAGEIHPVGRVVGGEIARVALHDALRHLRLVERRIDELLGEKRLVVADRTMKNCWSETRSRDAIVRIVVHAQFLAAQIFVDLEGLPG